MEVGPTRRSPQDLQKPRVYGREGHTSTGINARVLRCGEIGRPVVGGSRSASRVSGVWWFGAPPSGGQEHVEPRRTLPDLSVLDESQPRTLHRLHEVGDGANAKAVVLEAAHRVGIAKPDDGLTGGPQRAR